MSARTLRGNVRVAARIASRFARFIRNEDGPTATEYAVILALIIMTAIGASQNLSAWYVDIQAALFA
jgi:Flp pilus assembly pilin Flp